MRHLSLAVASFTVAAMVMAAPNAWAQSDADARIKALEQQLELLKQELELLKQDQAETKARADEAQTTADEVKESVAASQPLVSSGNSGVKLAISGQINRAVNVANDGDTTKAYFVDNDVSNSRFRLVGTANLDDATTLGTKIELGISPNNSSNVSQDNEDAGDTFDERVVEVFARNDSYGQLSLGKGSTASDNTAEYDLSLVAGPIMYSGVADIVGGLRFTDGNNLSDIRVDDAFFNFDGLGRKDRVLYDTPVFGPGLQLSTSAASDQRYDLALNWGGDYGDWSGVEFGDFVTLGAIAISDPNEDDVNYRLDGSFSVLHDPTGLSLTLAAGGESVDNGENPLNLYAKAGWDTEFFDFGATGFGLDVTRATDICFDCDTGYSLGLAGVQTLDEWGVELYTQFRWFTIDTDTTDSLDDIYVMTAGTRVKF